MLCKHNQGEQGRKEKENKGKKEKTAYLFTDGNMIPLIFKPVTHITMGKSLVKVQSTLKNKCRFMCGF